MTVAGERGGVLVVLPSSVGRSATVHSQWLAAAHLARALGLLLGGADVLTPSGLLSPDQVEEEAVQEAFSSSPARAAVRRLPVSSRLLLGDLRIWRQARRMRARGDLLRARGYRLVVQFHHRFHSCGVALAQQVGAPLVLRVEALEVQEEEAWGLPRPLFGRFVERFGELRIARRADLVASVSDAVDSQLGRLGIHPQQRVVIPNGVDLNAFSPGEPDQHLRRLHGLDGRLVVGWVGGFRPFHGLELVADVARGLRERVPQAILCLVGTGPLHNEMAEQARALPDQIRLVGPAAPKDVPRWIRSFDVCLLLASSDEFHYSPLKLYEYLGCGRPVVAARVGQVAQTVRDSVESLLVPTNDASAVVAAIERLAQDPVLRELMGKNARTTAERATSWDARALHLVEALEARGCLEPHTANRDLAQFPPAPAPEHGVG
ncbi:MAG: glycosyltransferase family 4 protein [Nitriliruptorales bacterium]